MSTHKKHTQYYVSLGFLLMLGLLLALYTRDNPQMRVISVILMTFCYVIWGIVHHILHHDTSVRVVIEYVLIGALGILLAVLV